MSAFRSLAAGGFLASLIDIAFGGRRKRRWRSRRCHVAAPGRRHRSPRSTRKSMTALPRARVNEIILAAPHEQCHKWRRRRARRGAGNRRRPRTPGSAIRQVALRGSLSHYRGCRVGARLHPIVRAFHISASCGLASASGSTLRDFDTAWPWRSSRLHSSKNNFRYLFSHLTGEPWDSFRATSLHSMILSQKRSV